MTEEQREEIMWLTIGSRTSLENLKKFLDGLNLSNFSLADILMEMVTHAYFKGRESAGVKTCIIRDEDEAIR